MSTGANISHRPGMRSPARFVGLSQLQKLRQCEQVAAVCYRVRKGEIEFLLVRTRGTGRWTFPKGSAEPGLTHAQAAALEAYEEAGVHGRIEELSFARYSCRKRGTKSLGAKSAEKSLVVNAHLCQVIRLGIPKESNRNRTWFSAHDAKLHLFEERKSQDAAALASVIDRAVARIKLLISEAKGCNDRPQSARQKDFLQEVQFEAPGRMRGTILNPYDRLELGQSRMTHAQPQYQRLLRGEVLQFSPGKKKV